jgi:uncharacterized protein YpmS
MSLVDYPVRVAIASTLIPENGNVQMAVSDFTMRPVAWLFISLFAGIILILAIVYLFALKIRRDKRKAERKAEGDEIFAKIIKNPVTTPAV